jgi:integrase
MAYLKIKVKKLDGNQKEIRAYAYDSLVEGGKQRHFMVENFGLCQDKRDAQERFKKWERTYNKANALAQYNAPNPTLREFHAEYLERNEQLTGGKHQAKMSMKHLLRLIGHLHLNQITKKVVLDYRDTRKNEPIRIRGKNTGNLPSPKTINHELSTLSSIIRKAIELERLDQHPFLQTGIGLKRNFFLKVVKNPRPALTRAEFQALMLNIVEERSRVITLLFATTGMRQSELSHLRLNDIDLTQDRITFRAPKTDDFRTQSIPTVLKPIFVKLLTHIPLRSGWRKRTDQQLTYVFCDENGARIKTPGSWFLHGAAKKAGIQKHVTPHILRHSFGSHAANQVNTWELKELMGHQNISTTEIYVKNFKAPGIDTANKITESLGIDSGLVDATVGAKGKNMAPILNQLKRALEKPYGFREKVVPEVGLEPTCP